MNNARPIADEFWPLLDAACADELTDGQWTELQSHLESSPAARRAFVEHIRLRTNIRQWWKGKRSREAGLSRIKTECAREGRVGDGRGMAGSPAIDGEEGFGIRDSGFGVRDSESLSADTAVELPSGQWPQTPSPEPPIPPIVIDLSSTSHYPLPTSHFSVGSWAFSYTVATVITGVMLLGFWAVEVTHHQHIAEAPSQLVPSDARPEMVFVGRITGMVDVKWSDDPRYLPPPDFAHVPLDRKYILDSGLLEITYDSGAKVILQGPCTYEVESTAGGYLSLGKLTAKVEKKKSEVRGQRSDPSPLSPLPSPLFSVRTPTALITDLGTEFGVEVSDEGTTTSHVFHGSVKVLVLDGAGNLPSPFGRGAGGEGSVREVILGENESARVERADGAGHLSIVRHAAESVPSDFVRAMPPPKHVAGSTSYAELVLSLNPAVYYRMERPKDEKDRLVVFDSAPGGHHGVLYLADEYGGSPYWSGRFGDSLRLRGQGAGDHAIVPDYPKAANDQLTVSAWVMLDSQNTWWAMIAANWGNVPISERPARGQFHFGLYQSDGDLSVQATQRDQKLLLVREGKDRPLPIGTWLHVAFVADGTTLRLYRNGVEVATGPCRDIFPRPPMASLGIGCKTTTAGTEASTRTPAFWRGRIDELAVFNRALSPAEVRKLAQSWE